MKGVSLFHVGAVAIVGLVSAGPVGAQDTRAEIESEARSEKAQSSSSAAAPERGFFEQAFTWATKKLDGSKDGFYPELGGLIPGSGWLGIGPGYRRHLFGDAALVDASAAISSRRYSMMQSRIEWPKLASDHVSLGAQVRYQDFTEINYFGIGPHTSKADQTDSRLQSLDIVGSATARPRDWFAVGARVGYMRSLNIEPGLSSIHPPTHERFDDTNAPGLTAHPATSTQTCSSRPTCAMSPDIRRYSFRRVEASPLSAASKASTSNPSGGNRRYRIPRSTTRAPTIRSGPPSVSWLSTTTPSGPRSGRLASATLPHHDT